MLLKESKLVYQPAFFIVTEMKSSLRKSLTKTLGLDLVNRLLPAVRNKPLILGLARNNIRMLKD